MLVLLLFVFVLAIFTGFELITKVPPTLHTPLMSGANAISGITIVGALICAKAAPDDDALTEGILDIGGIARGIGFLAIVFATINVVGGFMVTDRMLAMFASKKKKKA